MTDSKKLDCIMSELQGVKGEIQGMKGEIQDIRDKVTRIDLTIENEIRVNIQRVAEGHLDLSRKLNESIKLANEVAARQEIQDIYINMHERKLKVL